MSVRTRPPSRADRTREKLVWQPLRGVEEGLDAVPGLHLGLDPQRGRAIALRATAGAREGGWAAHAAAAIAGAGAAQGARVLLADLFLEEPHLHEAFGARNLEGLSDAIAYGASLGRIARAAAVGDAAFRVATAGTPVADAGPLLDRPRWRDAVESLLAEGIVLLAYQPAESTVLPDGTPSIVLARKGEPTTALGSAGLRDARAVLGPPPGAAVEGASGGVARSLARQDYETSPWEGIGGGAPSGEAPSSGEETVGGLGAAKPPASGEGTVGTGPAAEAGPASLDAGIRGRRLGVSAFAVLLLFATLMTLMAVHNAGLAEVPGADRAWEWFEGLLARIGQLFVR